MKIERVYETEMCDETVPNSLISQSHQTLPKLEVIFPTLVVSPKEIAKRRKKQS